MVEIDATAFRNINFIVTKLQELSLYLFADGLIRQSKELDEAINTIKGIMEHDVCIGTDCSKKGEREITKIVLNDIVDLIETLFKEVNTNSKRIYDEQNEFEAYISKRINSIRYDIEQSTWL